RAVSLCLGGDRAPLGCERRAGEPVGLKRRGTLLVLRLQLVLLPRRVERGERVLPLPDEQRPDEREQARSGQDGSEDAYVTPQVSLLTRDEPTRMPGDVRDGPGRCAGQRVGRGRAWVAL